ncbi:unnamed protein product [Notodromas monacha]|uniref:Chloride channel CLIC-like protein 1 n=1 Tax=Notodromas monacha TaxID=399045 RepID=A0A7R9BG55_9CRUS|nr:unnamed protein product [Notodromas monacha]CAG0914672.1 unnamed protein product [Notodromas monacha]
MRLQLVVAVFLACSFGNCVKKSWVDPKSVRATAPAPDKSGWVSSDAKRRDTKGLPAERICHPSSKAPALFARLVKRILFLFEEYSEKSGSSIKTREFVLKMQMSSEAEEFLERFTSDGTEIEDYHRIHEVLDSLLDPNNVVRKPSLKEMDEIDHESGWLRLVADVISVCSAFIATIVSLILANINMGVLLGICGIMMTYAVYKVFLGHWHLSRFLVAVFLITFFWQGFRQYESLLNKRNGVLRMGEQLRCDEKARQYIQHIPWYNFWSERPSLNDSTCEEYFVAVEKAVWFEMDPGKMLVDVVALGFPLVNQYYAALVEGTSWTSYFGSLVFGSLVPIVVLFFCCGYEFSLLPFVGVIRPGAHRYAAYEEPPPRPGPSVAARERPMVEEDPGRWPVLQSMSTDELISHQHLVRALLQVRVGLPIKRRVSAPVINRVPSPPRRSLSEPDARSVPLPSIRGVRSIFEKVAEVNESETESTGGGSENSVFVVSEWGAEDSANFDLDDFHFESDDFWDDAQQESS